MKKMLMVLFCGVFAYLAAGQGAAETIRMDSVSVVRLVDSLKTICRSLVKEKKYAESLPVFLSARDWTRRLWGAENIQYIGLTNNLGMLNKELGHYREAEHFFLESTPLIKKIMRRESAAYSSNVNELAGIYFHMGRYKDSERFYLEAIKIAEEVSSKSDPDFAINLNNLGHLYISMGKFKEAEAKLLESKNLLDSVVGVKDQRYMTPIYNLGLLYRQWGQYGKAEQYANLAKNLRAQTVGTEHYDYAASLNSLGNLYKDMGRYDSAESYLLKTIALLEKLFGKEHWYYSIGLENLGNVYKLMGRYDLAEPFLLDAKNIKAKTIGTAHEDYARNLSNLAQVYGDMGRYHEAEVLFWESKNITEKSLGNEHNSVAFKLNDLGFLYHKMRLLSKADSCYRAAQTIQEKAIGKENPFYAGLLDNLARVSGEMGRRDLEEEFLLEARNIKEKTLGKEHPYFALNSCAFGVLFRETGRLEDAEQKFLEAKNIFEKTVSKENGDYAKTLQEIGILYAKSNNHIKATTAFLEAKVLSQRALARATRHLSERELTDYIGVFENENAVRLSYALSQTETEIAGSCFDDAIFYKGFVLNSAVRMRNIAYANTSAAQVFERMAICQASLSKMYSQQLADRKMIADLEQQANDLEKDLVRRVAGFGDAFKPIRWQDVQQKIRPSEAAIEFVSFKKSFPKPTDTILYAALLLRPTDTIPTFIPLFEEKQLLNTLRRGGMSAKEQIEDVYRSKTGKALYKLIWQPLEPYLKDVKTIHFSPSGLLHSISFAAIPTNSGQYLADQYELRQYGSTRELVTGHTLQDDSIQNARVYGGIRYDTTDISHKLCNTDIPRGGLDYLSCSPYEMRQVRDILVKEGIKTDTLSGFEATEETMKPGPSALTINRRSPNLLHISTHGTYLPHAEKQDSVSARPLFLEMNSPLARSFLAFAGAGDAFHGHPRPDVEDGLLTAFEISSLDLSGTKLAVLSACETALGDIRGSEGVYGLQRAFKIAGVEHLIVSLWKVEDSEATLDFMSTFYRHFFSGLEVRDAFSKTQREMREKHKNPYLWAAFVLI